MKLIKYVAMAAIIAGSNAVSTPSSFAFMMGAVDATATGGIDTLTATVASIRAEIEAGEIKCEDMLEKINAAIEQIDVTLDKGVLNEKIFFGLYDELVELRLDLPCLGNELAQGLGDGSTVISEPVVAEQVVGSPAAAGGCVNCGGTPGLAGGGGGGGGFAGGGAGGMGGGIGPLALGGIAAAIAIPLAVTSDNPGVIASPSN